MYRSRHNAVESLGSSKNTSQVIRVRAPGNRSTYEINEYRKQATRSQSRYHAGNAASVYLF